MKTWWAEHSRCPTCMGELKWDSDAVRCLACFEEFMGVAGVPILISAHNSTFNSTEIASSPGTVTERRGLRRFIPSISLNSNAEANYRTIATMLGEQSQNPRILVIGAGEGGDGEFELKRFRRSTVRSDVAIGRGTDACLDAHSIPFADFTFDAVVAQAVLEHVIDPRKCVDEIHRVLKPGGLVYAETPFMQQVHMGAHDYTRFTMSGHRMLFSRFTEVASGVAVGPGSALAWSLVYFMVSFTKTRRSRQFVNAGARFLFFWLKYFDVALRNRPAAEDAAAGVYFIGKSRRDDTEARTISARYSGGM